MGPETKAGDNLPRHVGHAVGTGYAPSVPFGTLLFVSGEMWDLNQGLLAGDISSSENQILLNSWNNDNNSYK